MYTQPKWLRGALAAAAAHIPLNADELLRFATFREQKQEPPPMTGHEGLEAAAAWVNHFSLISYAEGYAAAAPLPQDGFVAFSFISPLRRLKSKFTDGKFSIRGSSLAACIFLKTLPICIY